MNMRQLRALGKLHLRMAEIYAKAANSLEADREAFLNTKKKAVKKKVVKKKTVKKKSR